MVRLRLQGTGPSNWNRVRISLLSEQGDEPVLYEFQITRKLDTTPPELIRSTVVGNELTLTYNEALDPGSTPAGGDFSGTVVDSATKVSSILAVSAVMVEDRSVILALDAPARFDDSVTLTYTKGDYPIRDPIGNPASDFQDWEVDNDTPINTTNTLIRLSLKDATLAPTFDPLYTSYAATVENEIKQTTVTAITTDPRAKVVITPEDGDGNTGGRQVALDVGDTTIEAVVTPEDINAAAGIYTITVTRLPDTIVPTLTAATVDGKMLTLTYDEALDEDSRPATGDFIVKVLDSVTDEKSSPIISEVHGDRCESYFRLRPGSPLPRRGDHGLCSGK